MTSKTLLALSIALIAAPATAQAEKPAKSPTADQTKYCVAYDTIVGSRVAKQECKTKEEWKKSRVDIDRMLNGK